MCVDFYDVFLVFVYLLKSYGLLLWQNEDIQFPQVVFDSIKDNPSYINLILELDIDYSRQSTVILDWFQAYLMSIRGTPIFEEVLKRLVSFACGELQHERFGDKRPFVMTALLEVFNILLAFDNI
jgi:senataxin